MARSKQADRQNPNRAKRPRYMRGMDPIDYPGSSISRDSRSRKAHESPKQAEERFRTPNYRKIYNIRFGTRKVALGRITDFTSFDTNNAGFVREWFEGQQLDTLMQEKEPIYPDLVRLFYTHFDKSNEEEGVIHTWVKGREIVLDDVTLGNILGIPATGVHDSTGKKWSKHEVFDKEKCIKLVLMDDDAERKIRPKVDSLPMPTRLLHLILMYTFISREGRKSSMTYLDLFVMYCILTKVKVNMPKLMINYMIAANMKRQGGGLPYGMWLTKVFKWFGVDLKDEVVTKNKKKKLNFSTITGDIGFSFDEATSQWISRGIKRAPRKEEMPGEGKGKENVDMVDDGGRREDDSLGCRTCANSKESVLESLVVQEMLCNIHPDIFTDEKMAYIRETAKTKMAKRLSEGYGMMTYDCYNVNVFHAIEFLISFYLKI